MKMKTITKSFITSHGRILITPKRDDASFINSGILKVKAFVTRTGVFQYQDQQGNIIRELRDAKEVFALNYLESMHGSPITIDHPADMVGMSTLKRDAVGFAGDSPFIEGDLVGIYLFIHDIATQDRLFNGELVEISSGYFAEVRQSENLAVADTEQFNMINNHFALLPPGSGRAGERVSIRFDSGLRCDSIASTIIDVNVNIKEDPKSEEKKDNIKKMDLKLGDKIFTDLAEDVVIAVQDALTVVKQDLPVSKEDSKVKLGELELKLDALEKKHIEYVEKEDSRIDNRVMLISESAYFLPQDYDFKGKKDNAIMLDVLNTFKDEGNEIKLDGLSSDFISGNYRATVDQYQSWLKERESELDSKLTQVHDAKAGIADDEDQDSLSNEEKLDKSYKKRDSMNKERFNKKSGYVRK